MSPSRTKDKDKDHVPRPKNSYFCFITDPDVKESARVVSDDRKRLGQENSKLPKVFGEMWEALPEESILFWEKKAAEETEQHRKDYPEYRYSPRRKSGSGSTGLRANGGNGRAGLLPGESVMTFETARKVPCKIGQESGSLGSVALKMPSTSSGEKEGTDCIQEFEKPRHSRTLQSHVWGQERSRWEGEVVASSEADEGHTPINQQPCLTSLPKEYKAPHIPFPDANAMATASRLAPEQDGVRDFNQSPPSDKEWDNDEVLKPIMISGADPQQPPSDLLIHKNYSDFDSKFTWPIVNVEPPLSLIERFYRFPLEEDAHTTV